MEIKSNEKSNTLLVYNRDYHMQRPVLFKDCFDMKPQEVYDIFCSFRYRTNTGTYLMTDTLARLLDARWIYPNDFEIMECGKAKTLVTNAFHCISPRFYFDRKYWQKVLDTGINIVPMTCGFRYHEEGTFNLTDDMICILKQISERNEIGVRGERTADILDGYGIKNVRVIGCHSLFYWNNRKFKIDKTDKSIKSLNFNFNQCYTDYFESHSQFCSLSLPFFEYIRRLFENRTVDIQYTMQTFFLKEWIGYNNFTKYELVKEFTEKCGEYYFSVEDWINGIKNVDMSIGTQFHGNIAAILAGVPALIVTIDDRMRELCAVHHIPNIDIKDFDPNKSLQYYYDNINYTDFNMCFAANYDNFLGYCDRNGVNLKR